jgi:uncharacterized protein YacL
MEDRGERIAVWAFRVLFFMAGSAVGYTAGHNVGMPLRFLLGGMGGSVIIIAFEWFISQRPLTAISSVVFGTITGILLAVLGVRVIELAIGAEALGDSRQDLTLGIGTVLVYLAVSILYQTRDKWRVVIPYVEFRKEEKGTNPVFLDTSVIVDGRISELLDTGIINDPIVIPRMVLRELHNIADSDNKLRRERGRLGMRMLDEVQKNEKLDVRIESLESDTSKPVDERLVDLAQQHNGRIMTNDYNLNRVATIGGVQIINLNELANALKPVALPDETLSVKLLRPGEQPGQAVGYLDDGTMVVVEDASESIGKQVDIVVTNTITRETGRMIFGRLASSSSESRHRSESSSRSGSGGRSGPGRRSR